MKFWRKTSMDKEAGTSDVPHGAPVDAVAPPEVPPDEQPSTPQSTNVSAEASADAAGGDAGGAEAAKKAALESLLADSDEGVEVIRSATPRAAETKQPQQDPLPADSSVDKNYARNMSALSVSTGESIGNSNEDVNVSFEDEEELPDTPKSSLVSGKKLPDHEAVNGGDANGVPPLPSKAVDRIPEINELNENTRGDGASGVTSQSVRLGDDVTETSFTTMTTAGDMGLERKAPPLVVDPSATVTSAVGAGVPGANGASTGAPSPAPAGARPRAVKPSRVRAVRAVPARSPRPPRHMRAVDWCPPSSSSASLGVASGSNRVSAGGAGGSAVASDKTAVTSRAVRLGDDATVTTFATMTTMGDAGSILEADTEDEASSTSEEEGTDPGTEDEVEGEDMEEVRTEEGSMEDVAYENGVVDKIPSRSRQVRAGSVSGTTNHSVRAADDQSMVTFATMEGGMQPPSADVQQVDRVPTIPSAGDNASMVTEDTVQMGDNRSLATWATTNTMGGQLTGNVVDHVPNEDGEGEEGEEDGEEGDAASPSDDTVGTSNAVKEDPSVTTFTTSVTAADSGINEVVDTIPTFAGGGGGTGRSVVSGVTSQAIRGSAGGVIPDDRSVTSFATMTTMGDLPDIFEHERLPDEDFTRQSVDDGSRPRVFSGSSFGEIDRHVVDVIPEAASSVASGTTNHSVRTGDDTGSVTTFGTMTTAGRELSARAEMDAENEDRHEGVVDKVPTYPTQGAASIVSGTTNMAVRLNDDQSVATWATAATSGVTGHVNEHVVDKTPSFKETRAETGGGGYSSMVSETTDQAIKDPEDQSVVTWNTMTTAGVTSRARAQSPPPAPEPYAVDRVPSYNQGRPGAPSLSGTTNHTIRAEDDRSVVTFATMTTAGGMERGAAQDQMVDRVPSIPPKTDTSIITADTVQMGDNRSLATWATSNTMGGAVTGNVVDHVPSTDEDENRTVGTSNAVKDDPSVTTFTTSAASSRGINEVVDRVPTFAGGGSGTGRSVVSGVTNRAVRMGDDRSVASFATMTTAGDMGGGAGGYEADGNPGRYSNEDNLVDRIPSSAGSIVSGRTDAAVRLGDDLTVGTFATMTTAGAEGGMSSDQSGEENDVASSSRPTAGILREGRHSRPSSALRSGRDYQTSTTDSSTAPAMKLGANDLPIAAGESVSNTHILRAISDLRFHVDYRMGELRELNRRDSDRVAQIVQQEQAKRMALEARLHSQLLMQSESMVAMELKLLRLEAKVSHRDSRRQQRIRQTGSLAGSGTTPSTNITDRLPPIAATPSTPNRSDEEEDSFEEMELTPRGANRRELGSGLYSHLGGGAMHRGGGPANIAVVTRSGASVASAVTATSFQEGVINDDERSGDGDIEDEGDDNDDGSASTPTHGSRYRLHAEPRLRPVAEISNLESINPIPLASDQGISTRAVRGDNDGTSFTSATVASTIVTATTRGNESIGFTRIASRASEEDALPEEGVLEGRRGLRSNSEEVAGTRSRSQSPLTVQSGRSAEPSLGTSILSTAAVAPSRAFGSRRANAAAAVANAQEGNRSMANRVVSFTTSGLADSGLAQSGAGLPPHMENDGGGDSITMPDELDNVSDIADAFSNSARVWREEYEARLDAIHKRLGG